MRKEVTIMAFEEPDRAALASLYEKVRLETFTWISKERLLSASFDFDTEGELILVARVDHEVAGFIGIWEQGSFIHHLYVLPKFQKQGVGRQLLEAGIARCTSTATLKCLAANSRAVDFYTKYGWTEKKRGGSWDGDYILFEYNAPSSAR